MTKKKKKVSLAEAQESLRLAIANLKDVTERFPRGTATLDHVRRKCLECAGGHVGVDECPNMACPIWPLRYGSNPSHGASQSGNGNGDTGSGGEAANDNPDRSSPENDVSNDNVAKAEPTEQNDGAESPSNSGESQSGEASSDQPTADDLFGWAKKS